MRVILALIKTTSSIHSPSELKDVAEIRDEPEKAFAKRNVFALRIRPQIRLEGTLERFCILIGILTISVPSSYSRVSCCSPVAGLTATTAPQNIP